VFTYIAAPFKFGSLWETGEKNRCRITLSAQSEVCERVFPATPIQADLSRSRRLHPGEQMNWWPQVHARMPVILPEEHHAKGLGEVENGDIKALLFDSARISAPLWDWMVIAIASAKGCKEQDDGRS
jgi:hypothetical protein